MSAPIWLLEAITATELKPVPIVPKPENESWEQYNKPETPIHKGFTDNVPTIPTVPKEIQPLIVNPETIDAQRERRRNKVMNLLEKGKRFALYVDDDLTDPVIATVGIQNVATFELEIPRHSYDGVVLLELIEKHYGATGS